MAGQSNNRVPTAAIICNNYDRRNTQSPITDFPVPDPDDIPARVAVLEEIFLATKVAIERLDRRLDALDRRLEALDRPLEALANAQRSHFRTLLTIMLVGFGMTAGAFIGMMGVAAHGFHWI